MPTPPAKRGWIHIGRKPCMHRPINIYVCMCARATSKSQETYPGLSLAYIGNGRFPERFVIVPCVCPTVDHFSITTPSLPRESPIPLPSYVARCYDDEHDPLPALPYPNPFPTPPFFFILVARAGLEHFFRTAFSKPANDSVSDVTDDWF